MGCKLHVTVTQVNAQEALARRAAELELRGHAGLGQSALQREQLLLQRLHHAHQGQHELRLEVGRGQVLAGFLLPADGRHVGFRRRPEGQVPLRAGAALESNGGVPLHGHAWTTTSA